MEHLRLRSQLMRQGRLRSTHLDHLKSEEIKEISCQNIFLKSYIPFYIWKLKKNNEMHGQQKNNFGNGNVYLVLLVWTSSIIYSLHQVVSPNRFPLLCARQLIEKTLLLLRDKQLLCRMRILSWSTTLKLPQDVIFRCQVPSDISMFIAEC